MIIFWRDAKVSTSRDNLEGWGRRGKSSKKHHFFHLWTAWIRSFWRRWTCNMEDGPTCQALCPKWFFPLSIYYIISLFRITEKNRVYKYSATELLIYFRNIFQNGPRLFIFFIIAILWNGRSCPWKWRRLQLVAHTMVSCVNKKSTITLQFLIQAGPYSPNQLLFNGRVGLCMQIYVLLTLLF